MRIFGRTSRKRVEELQHANRGLRRDGAEKDAEIARVEHERDRLQHERARLASERDRLRRERDRLKQELAAAQRTRKRQAAPFSKGKPKSAPRKPGRKGGPKYGPTRRRDIPAQVDEELAAPLPGVVAHDRVEDQCQAEIVRTVRVTRIRVHIGHCVACGTRVQGRHPRQTSDARGAAAAQLGPDASALATLLNTQMGLSLGKPAAVLQQTFGLRVTPGGVSPAVARVGRQCTPTYAALTQRVGASASVTIDDTGWRVGGVPPWRFAAATPAATVFASAAGRGTADAETLLSADVDGCLVRDGAAIYRAFATPYQQTGKNHLIHRCTRRLEQASAVFPREVKALLQPGLALRDRFAAEEVSAHGLKVATGRLEAALARLLDPCYRADENRRLANHLDREFPFLFAYLKCPGLEATNYRAEPAIRPAAVIRTVWGGNRTAAGARTQEILMSVLRPSQQNDVDPLPLIADLLRTPTSWRWCRYAPLPPDRFTHPRPPDRGLISPPHPDPGLTPTCLTDGRYQARLATTRPWTASL